MLHGQPYKQQNPLCISVGGLVVHFRGLKLWYVYAVSCHLTAQNPVNYNTLCALYVQFFNLRCFHIFLAFFNKKQRCRMILDDSVTRKRAGGRRRTETLTYTGFFTQRSLYTERLLDTEILHGEVFIRSGFYTEAFLHGEVFTLYTKEFLQTNAFTQKNFYTQKFLHKEVFTQRGFYTQTPLHAEVFTQRSIYTEEFLQFFTHKSVYNRLHFTHSSCYTQKPLHKEVFTQRILTHRRVY